MPDSPRLPLFSLLRQLADGKFHSGEALAGLFGVSRASVCNAMAQAETFGVRVQAIRGRGYRLPDSVDWLDPSVVVGQLGSLASHFHLHVYDTLASTNDWLMAQPAMRVGDGWVCAAEYQTAGKGRRGRAWQSAPGGGLTFSVLYRLDAGLAGLSGLSLAVGVAVARALNRYTTHGIALKWPNDLVVGPRKLGGVLVEVQGDVDGPASAVIGIGLNVRLPATVREHIEQAVVDLTELGAGVSRNQLLAACLAELHTVMAGFRSRGFASVREAWMALDAYRDRDVLLVRADGSRITGRAAGVDAGGALLLRRGDGQLVAYSGGELSLRLAR